MKKLTACLILLFSFLVLNNAFAGSDKAKEYWSRQTFILEYNPIFHCSMSVGGEIDMSIWEIFGFHWEGLYLNTAMFTPYSFGINQPQKVGHQMEV